MRQENEKRGVAPRETAYDRVRAGGEFPTGIFNRDSGGSDIHPGAWNRVYQENLKSGKLGGPRDWHRRNKAGPMQPTIL